MEENWFEKFPEIEGLSHFNNLHSSNWNSMRLKLPPTEDSSIGWRVEFRPMDIQCSDFENSALIIFTSMLANVVNSFNVNFLLPTTLVNENMKRVHQRSSLTDLKFWFRTNILPIEGNYKISDLKDFDFLSSKLSHPKKDEFKELFIW